MIDPGGGGPASSGVELPAELVGALGPVRSCPDGDQVTVRGIRHEHGMRKVRTLPRELVAQRSGDAPGPGLVREHVDAEPVALDFRREVGGEGHVRGVPFAEPEKDFVSRQEVEGTAVRTEPVMKPVRAESEDPRRLRP